MANDAERRLEEEAERELALLVAEADWSRLVPRLMLFTNCLLGIYCWHALRHGKSSADYVERSVAEALAGEHTHHFQKGKALFAFLCVVIEDVIVKDAEKVDADGKSGVFRRQVEM